MDKPFLPKLSDLKKIRKGSKISRYFRYLFEHDKIKKILGANIALMIVASTLVPTASNLETANLPENILVGNGETPLITTVSAIRYPVNAVKVTQGYKIYHPGLDFDGVTGEPIYPIINGVVEDVSYSRYGYGNAIIISHGNEVTSLYAHLTKIMVDKGQAVDTSTVIGNMGATGRASGDHLHLEVRDHGRQVNPYLVLPHINQ